MAEGGCDAGNSNTFNNTKCVFCRICSSSSQQLVYEDEDFVSFADRSPASTHHFLVVPRKHISGAGQLTSVDQPMVKRMAEIGGQILADRSCDVEDCLLGFHWPPLITVKHLHMHVISPASQMKWIHRAFVFKKDSYFFSSPEYIVDYIKKKC